MGLWWFRGESIDTVAASANGLRCVVRKSAYVRAEARGIGQGLCVRCDFMQKPCTRLLARHTTDPKLRAGTSHEIINPANPRRSAKESLRETQGIIYHTSSIKHHLPKRCSRTVSDTRSKYECEEARFILAPAPSRTLIVGTHLVRRLQVVVVVAQEMFPRAAHHRDVVHWFRVLHHCTTQQ